MKRKTMRKLIATLFALLLPAAAFANGYDVPNVNPRDLAMVGSVVADQQTAAAAFANPAALSKIEGLSIDVGGSLLDNMTTWNDTTGLLSPSKVDTDVSLTVPPSLNVAYGTKLGGHGFGVGLAMNILGGAHVFWPNDWPGRFRIISVDRKVYGFFLTAGYELVKQVRIGGGLVYYRTTEDLLQAADPLIPQATAELSASGGALAYDLSAEITPFDGIPLSFGIDYKHQGVQKLTGDAHFSNVPLAFQTNPRLQDQGVTHYLTYPNALNLGAAYRVIPEVLLTFGWTFNRYIVYDKDVFTGDKVPNQPIVVPRDYRNGWTYRLGVEWSTTPRLKLRGGLERDISGMPKLDNVSGLVSPTYSPTLPDSDSWIAAVGAGYDITPAFTVQGALWHAWFDEASSSNTTDPFASNQPFPGRYQTNVWVFGAGIVYRWNPNK
jgi:long-chain fatty acid transport protein